MSDLSRSARALIACAAVVAVAWLLVIGVSGGIYWGSCTTAAIGPLPAHCDTAFRTFTLFSLVGMALACAAAVGLGGTVKA